VREEDGGGGLGKVDTKRDFERSSVEDRGRWEESGAQLGTGAAKVVERGVKLGGQDEELCGFYR